MTAAEEQTRRLILFRHAKSDWQFNGLPDFYRPPNARGERDLPKMAARLRELAEPPDLLCSSPAARTFATAFGIIDAYQLPDTVVRYDRALYLASEEGLLDYIYALPEDCYAALLVGHNPGLADLANRFSPEPINKFPTAAFVILDFACPFWTELSKTVATRVAFEYPKKGTPDDY